METLWTILAWKDDLSGGTVVTLIKASVTEDNSHHDNGEV